MHTFLLYKLQKICTGSLVELLIRVFVCVCVLGDGKGWFLSLAVVTLKALGHEQLPEVLRGELLNVLAVVVDLSL